MEKYKCIPGKRLALKIAFQYWSITGWWYLHLKQYSRCYLKAVILWEWYSTTDRGVMEFYQMLQKMSSVSDEQLSEHLERGSQLVFFLLLVATKDSALSLCFCLTWEKEMKILKEGGSFPWRDFWKSLYLSWVFWFTKCKRVTPFILWIDNVTLNDVHRHPGGWNKETIVEDLFSLEISAEFWVVANVKDTILSQLLVQLLQPCHIRL